MKWDADVLEVEDEHPLKKKHVAFTNKDVAKARCQTLTSKQLYWLKFCQNASNPSPKQDAAALTDKDVDWLKHEISEIKECMKAMAEHLRGNVEYRLEELGLDIQEWSWASRYWLSECIIMKIFLLIALYHKTAIVDPDGIYMPC